MQDIVLHCPFSDPELEILSIARHADSEMLDPLPGGQ